MSITAVSHLKSLYNHVEDITNGILGPEAVRIYEGIADLWKYTKGNVFKGEFGKHRKCVVVAEQRMASLRYLPQNLEMALAFLSHSYHSNYDVVAF